MNCRDSTYGIDLANGSPGAMDKAGDLSTTGERLAILAPARTELLVGAFRQGAKRLAQALEYISVLARPV